MNTIHSEQISRLYKIVKDGKTAMMVTHSQEGFHGRPMANAEVNEKAHLISFAADRTSGKIDELHADPRVFLSYTHGANMEWATITGTARVNDSRAKIRELWQPIWKNWFDGPDDPRIVLIEVIPESGEYWDPGNRAIAMVRFALTAVTGRKMPEGEHAVVKM